MIWSTVALNCCGPSSAPLSPSRLAARLPPGVELPDLVEPGLLSPLRGACEAERWKICEVSGLSLSAEAGPGVPAGVLKDEMDEARSLARGRSVSSAARRRRLVVPVALVAPERAEQTIAIRCFELIADGTMSVAITSRNLPTEVPPILAITCGQIPTRRVNLGRATRLNQFSRVGGLPRGCLAGWTAAVRRRPLGQAWGWGSKLVRRNRGGGQITGRLSWGGGGAGKLAR